MWSSEPPLHISASRDVVTSDLRRSMPFKEALGDGPTRSYALTGATPCHAPPLSSPRNLSIPPPPIVTPSGTRGQARGPNGGMGASRDNPSIPDSRGFAPKPRGASDADHQMNPIPFFRPRGPGGLADARPSVTPRAPRRGARTPRIQPTNQAGLWPRGDGPVDDMKDVVAGRDVCHAPTGETLSPSADRREPDEE